MPNSAPKLIPNNSQSDSVCVSFQIIWRLFSHAIWRQLLWSRKHLPAYTQRRSGAPTSLKYAKYTVEIERHLSWKMTYL